MSLGAKQEIFTSNIAKLIIYAESAGYRARLREVTRAKEQQEIYIKEKKSMTTDSAHLSSLAADIYFTKCGKLLETISDIEPIGAYWESLDKGNIWGGRWKSLVDTPHFEMR